MRLNHVILSKPALNRILAASTLPGLVAFVYVGFAMAFHLVGVLTAFAAIFLSAMAGALAGYRRERGLWMLSALFTILAAAFTLLAGIACVQDLVRGGRPIGWLDIDGMVATCVVGLVAWVTASAGIWNWRLTRRRPPDAPPLPPSDPSPVPAPLIPRPPVLSTHASPEVVRA